MRPEFVALRAVACAKPMAFADGSPPIQDLRELGVRLGLSINR